MNQSLNLRITERDQDLLDALASYRFLSVPQATALFFRSRSTCEERLRKLLVEKLVVRVFMPARPNDRSVHTIYALARQGSRLLAPRHDGQAPQYLTEREHRSGLFLDHTLRQNDLRVCLELLDRELPGFHLLLWKQAPEEVRGEAKVSTIGRRVERIPVVPDGVFAVRYKGAIQAFAVEIDMGTVAAIRMKWRYAGYYRWWKRGGMAARFGAVPLRVLTLTTTSSRLARLRAMALMAPEGKQGSALFWFATLDVLDFADPTRLLAARWTRATRTNPGPYPLFDPN